jgi:hypothetical protein
VKIGEAKPKDRVVFMLAPGKPEFGTVTGISPSKVIAYVKFDGDSNSKATHVAELQLESVYKARQAAD